MPNQETDQEPVARPLSSGPDASEPSGQDATGERLRENIRRLQRELAEREAQTRPMPSSVMRAYQKLLDRQFSELAAHDINNL